MKNKREVILDFTSLLDVIMLILFFFVIFAQLDTNETIANAETAMAAAEQQLADAKDEWIAANKAKEQANAELEKLQEANALAESVIINGVTDFNRAIRLKLKLTGDGEEWKIIVNVSTTDKGKVVYTEIGTISDVRNREPLDIANDFDTIIKEYGYTCDDAILCDLIFNSEEIGSNKAERNTDEMLANLQDKLQYKFLFCSTTDLSDLEE